MVSSVSADVDVDVEDYIVLANCFMVKCGGKDQTLESVWVIVLEAVSCCNCSKYQLLQDWSIFWPKKKTLNCGFCRLTCHSILIAPVDRYLASLMGYHHVPVLYGRSYVGSDRPQRRPMSQNNRSAFTYPQDWFQLSALKRRLTKGDTSLIPKYYTFHSITQKATNLSFLRKYRPAYKGLTQ